MQVEESADTIEPTISTCSAGGVDKAAAQAASPTAKEEIAVEKDALQTSAATKGKTAGDERDNVLLTVDETWKVAKYFFPGLMMKREAATFATHNDIQAYLRDDIDRKLREIEANDLDKYFALVKRENAAELCITLGMDEKYVRMRYGAVNAIHKELGFKSKTSTLTSLFHLIETLHIRG
ncbi:expressed unknown protein [Seminavis robusta]|uniref:Uncharacterized protein n=1 Tax=Seminavis robusta TaxID=568900 RepID=A0A9N8DF11_9STRA|nr:expressed unknown protein [Seminavis robusta]|eukprot:Sro112_g055730.1 n/a (180) ;mRNA; f:72449-72988